MATFLGFACGGSGGGGGSSPSGYSWSHVGPRGGFVPAIVFHPSRAGEVWASGDDAGGLYKSADYGATWTAVEGVGFNQSTYSLVFDPTDSNVIFAPNHFGRGMVRSSDGGTTWTVSQAGLPLLGNNDQLLYGLAVNP
ncbi:MAG TPA: hypothetical protein VFV50_02555, partial [Bdellovibrionales bacterium]|nr:hypothetical protein [Bdellovibrionales bacterium]